MIEGQANVVGKESSMGRIVVGCDGSPSAIAAVEWAAREGDVRGCPVDAVFAWDFLRQPLESSGAPFDPHFGEAEARELLTHWLRDVAGGLGEHVHPVVICDLPARALLEASASADLLVVGARGLGGVRGALLGSVSQQCVHHSPVPVAVIRAEPPTAAHGIVVAVDGSQGAQRALEWALDEAAVRGCGLSVVHAWRPAPSPVLTVPVGLSVPTAWPDMSGLQRDAEDVVDRALRRALTPDRSAVAIDPRPVCGNVVDVLLEESRHAELLVVGSRGRGGFAGLLLGSVSQHAVHHAAGPVVVVPPPRRDVGAIPEGAPS